MWIVEFGKFLLESMKRGIIGNVIAMIVISCGLAWGGFTFANNKHNEALKKIEENKKKIESVSKIQQKTATTLVVIQSTLQNIAQNLKDVREDQKIMKSRVWQIREDQLKRN